MQMQYKSLNIVHNGNNDEAQIYITENHVTAEAIKSGDDTGVVCLMIDPSKAQLVVDCLNRGA